MRFYNKVMLYFWLAAAVVIFVSTTYMGLTEGFQKWVYYYVFAILALLMFIFRKWMMRRMERHLEFLEEQKKAQKN